VYDGNTATDQKGWEIIDRVKMPEALPQLVFIWIGDVLPKWVTPALKLSSRSCGLEISLIACKAALEKAPSFVNGCCIEDFYKREEWIEKVFPENVRNFRDGFWVKTYERFIVLQAYMEACKVEKVFHAELDNLVFDISSLSSRLDAVGRGFFCPRDSVERGIGSLIYVNDSSRLRYMNEWFRQNSSLVKNEMELLGYMLANAPGFYSLPIESALNDYQKEKWEHLQISETEGVFDAAALGQYLFGVDPRNHSGVLYNGFVNENALLDFSAIRFRSDAKLQGLCFKVAGKGEWSRCYNLHVHSKIFKKIAHYSWTERVISRLNEGRRSLVCLNIGNMGYKNVLMLLARRMRRCQ